MALFSKKPSTDVPRRRQIDMTTHERPSEQSLQDRYAFRRNRTLIGSKSSEVMSSNESNAQLKSPRVQAHDLARHRRHIGVVLLAVALMIMILAILVYEFTAHANVRANELTVKLDDKYATQIDTYLQSQPIERFRFVLDEQRLTRYLQAKSPEIKSVTIDGSAGLGETKFVLTMRQPIAGWSIRGSEQFVDESGTSFSRNYYATPTVRVVDNSGVQAISGQAVASDQFLSFVGVIVGLSSMYNYTVTQVEIPQGTTRQVELRLKDVSYPIKLSVDRPAGEQVEDMTRANVWLKGRG